VAGWVMAVEVTPSELVAVDIDRADRAAGGSLRPRRVPLDPDGDPTHADGSDPVDVLADAFARVLGSAEPGGPADAADEDRPARLVIATPPDTERRRFEEIAEATALVGLPAPAWLPGPVALVGDRIAAEVELGGQSVVLDARGGGLTTWPVRRTAAGAEIGSRGPIATGTRLDQLLLGVVRAQLHSLDPDGAAAPGDGPSPGSRTTSGARDLRGEAARLRRGIRRARAQLAGEEVDEARVATEGHDVVVDRGVFDQLVEHALRETLAEVADGPERPRDLVVHVLGDRTTPLARRLVELTAGRERAEGALVAPNSPHDGVIGLAALLLPARSRPTRAATGAQAIRAARAVGSPSAPIGVPAGVGGPGLGARRAGGGGSGPDDGHGSDGHGSDGHGPDGHGSDGHGPDGHGHGPDDGSMPTPATGWSLPDDADDSDGADAAIPEARMPSTPVQAHRGLSGGGLGLAGVGAAGVGAGIVGAVAAPADQETDDGPGRAAEETPEAGAVEGPAEGDESLDHDGLDHDGLDHDGLDHDGLDHDGPAHDGEDQDTVGHHDGPISRDADQGAPDEFHADRAPAGHLALAAAAPHEVRPASDAPPGGRPGGATSPVSATAGVPESDADAWDQEREAGLPPRAVVRGRRGPDTAPQPVPEPPRPGLAPRGVVPVLVVLVVLAVLAAVGVLLVGPDQVDAAFAGLGAGTGLAPTALWGVSW
jgi:hypothetical protein